MENVLKTISFQQLADGFTMRPDNSNKEYNEKMDQMEQHLLNRLERDSKYLVQQPALYMPTNPD